MSNLIPTVVTDKNGVQRTVHKSADGRGRPNLSERAAYKADAASVPVFSPYKRSNVIYADDLFIGERDRHNGIAYARLHEDNEVELIGWDASSNVYLTPNDVERLGLLSDKSQGSVTSNTVELDNGGNARLALDGALVITIGDSEAPLVNDIPVANTAILLDQLFDWSH